MLVMLLILYDVCQMKKRKWLTWTLIGISFLFFALAASGDWLGLYYRSVSLEIVNGTSHLVKEYGPMHTVFIVMVLAYFLLSIGAIVYNLQCA